MKVYNIVSDGDGGVVVTTYATRDMAEAAYLELVYASGLGNFEDYEEAWDAVQDDADNSDWNVWITETHLQGSTPIKNALGALNDALTRLEINDLEGEEQPYVEAVHTAATNLDNMLKG